MIVVSPVQWRTDSVPAGSRDMSQTLCMKDLLDGGVDTNHPRQNQGHTGRYLCRSRQVAIALSVPSWGPVASLLQKNWSKTPCAVRPTSRMKGYQFTSGRPPARRAPRLGASQMCTWSSRYLTVRSEYGPVFQGVVAGDNWLRSEYSPVFQGVVAGDNWLRCGPVIRQRGKGPGRGGRYRPGHCGWLPENPQPRVCGYVGFQKCVDSR
jgi:hypothetical protein